MNVDVCHATDHPDVDQRKIGQITLSGGPVLASGPNTNPLVFDRLAEVATAEKIPYQVFADAHPSDTDASVVQMANNGVATGLIFVPLRYMHTPCEVVDLKVVEQAVRLLTAFTKSLKKDETFAW
ncbi:MAG: hypothetical protein LBT53_00380 [Puniceicoccales bacterium]|nr:hypothetical protein [Puniceicoccales bacterium]